MRYFSSFTGAGGFDLAVPEDWECHRHRDKPRICGIDKEKAYMGL